MTRVAAIGAFGLALALSTGCATLAPAPPVSGGAPAHRDTTAASRGAAQYPPGVSPARPWVAPHGPAAAAAVDSTPSAEALAVLATIPEPLSASDRVPPPEPAPPPDTSAAASLPPPPSDSSAAPGAPADTSEIPVPTPTAPLGDRPSSETPLTGPPPATEPAPSTGAPQGPAGPPSEARPGPPAHEEPASAEPDTCWRLQIAAPTERAKAERLRSAAESLLLVPMVVEPEKRLYKVRSKGCVDRVSSERLRERALGSGFAGAFRFVQPRR